MADSLQSSALLENELSQERKQSQTSLLLEGNSIKRASRLQSNDRNREKQSHPQSTAGMSPGLNLKEIILDDCVQINRIVKQNSTKSKTQVENNKTLLNIKMKRDQAKDTFLKGSRDSFNNQVLKANVNEKSEDERKRYDPNKPASRTANQSILDSLILDQFPTNDGRVPVPPIK